MASNSGARRQRNDYGGAFDGGWVWIALPIGILVVIAALWFLVIAPAGSAPPRVTITPAGAATEWPTVTPMVVTVPTETVGEEPTSEQPTALVVGARVEVTGTGVNMLRVRQDPGTTGAVVKLVPDGTKLVVVGGPETVDELSWWKVDDEDGTVGWVAGDYLSVSQ